MKNEKKNRFQQFGGKAARFRIKWILLSCVCCLLSFGMTESGGDTPSTLQARTAIEKWIETQRIISQEKRDLALAREMLTERISLVGREIESLKTKIGEANAGIAETDKKRAEMVEENEKLRQATAGLSGTLSNMEGRVRHLVERLPEPVRERIKPLSQRLPNNSEQTKQSAAERFQNIVGILNELDKFNREVSVASEVRTLADGSSVEVATLYMGLGQAFYAGSNGTLAGTGIASESGWDWRSANESALQINTAIAILKNEQVASFVQMPVEIK